MKKRILAFALTLAMVVTSLSMLSFVSFAEDAPLDDVVPEASTMLLAGAGVVGEAIDIASLATATASYNLGNGTLTINVEGADLANVKANVGGYETTATAIDGAATITVALDEMVIYKDNLGNAVADLAITAVTTADQGVFAGTLVLCEKLLLTATPVDLGIYNGVGGTRPAAGSINVDSTSTDSTGRFIFATKKYDHLWMKETGREATLDFKATSMTAYPVSEIKPEGYGYSTTGSVSPQDRIALFLAGCTSPDGTPANVYSKGSIKIVFINAYEEDAEDAYIYISFQDFTGEHHLVSTGKKVGEKFSVRLVWNMDNTGSIYVGDTEVIYSTSIVSYDSGIKGGTQFNGMSTEDKSFFMLEGYRVKADNETPLVAEISNYTIYEYAQAAVSGYGRTNTKFVFSSTGLFSANTSLVYENNTTVGYQNSNVTIKDVPESGNRLYAMQAWGELSTPISREFNMNLTVNALQDADFTAVTVPTIGGPTPALTGFEALIFSVNAKVSTKDTASAMAFFLVNDTNRGLMLIHQSVIKGKVEIVLEKEVGDTFNLRIVWLQNNRGAVYVDNTLVYVADEMRSVGNVAKGNDDTWDSTFAFTGNNAHSLIAFNFMRQNPKEGSEYASFSINNFTVFKMATRKVAVDADYLVGLSSANNVDSNGGIKLSYVQETTPLTAVTGDALTNNVGSGWGGSVTANKTFAVKNDGTNVRAFAQGGFAPLGQYGGNRTINFTLNVTKLPTYDFSINPTAGDALVGDAKYTENILAVYGQNQGLAAGNNDVSADAYDKLLIGAVAKISANGDSYGAMACYIVNDTNDGLVLIHTDYHGRETVIYIGDKLEENINVTIVWNKDNTGSIKIGDSTAVEISNITTVITDFSGGSYNESPQCYFSGQPVAYNGYIGFNSATSVANKTVAGAIDATLTLGETRVEMPLNVRFVATINTLNAKEAGFEINLKGSEKVVTKTTDTAYNAISAGNDVEKIYAPDGSYFVAVTINGVPTTGTVTFVVRPFYTYAGETIYGAAYEVTYTNGAFVSAVAAE